MLRSGSWRPRIPAASHLGCSAGEPLASVDLEGLDYISQIDAVPLRTDAGPEALAIVATLRPTGGRAVLAVVGGDGTVLHKQILKHLRSLKRPVLWRVARDGKPDVAVVDLEPSVTIEVTER